MKTTQYPEEIIKAMDELFPKGKDKRRGDALVLQAVAYFEGKKHQKKEFKEMIEKRFISELKKEIKNWICKGMPINCIDVVDYLWDNALNNFGDKDG